MAHSKASIFEQDEFIFSTYCKSLGHPARRRIVDLLHQHHTLTFGELCGQIDLHRTTIQNHIIRLQQVGLIRVFRSPEGKMGYQLNALAHEEMLEMMQAYVLGRVG